MAIIELHADEGSFDKCEKICNEALSNTVSPSGEHWYLFTRIKASLLASQGRRDEVIALLQQCVDDFPPASVRYDFEYILRNLDSPPDDSTNSLLNHRFIPADLSITLGEARECERFRLRPINPGAQYENNSLQSHHVKYPLSESSVKPQLIGELPVMQKLNVAELYKLQCRLNEYSVHDNLEASHLATVIAWIEDLLDEECKEKRGVPEWVKSTLDELACDQREKGKQSEKPLH
jgi:hypothetical protein